MFRKIIELLRKGAYKIGILKGIEKVADHKDISINEEMYDLIDMYKMLYRGYYKPWHHVEYKTIDGIKTRDRDTINMAKTAASEMASLVYNEKCEISIGDDVNKTALFVNDVLKRNKFDKKFQDFLEYSFAMGGMVIKPYVDDNEIKLSFVTADCFIPITWSNETITEGVFINETQKGDKKYTLLEWHTWEKEKSGEPIYTVTNELYESESSTELGRKVPLDTLYPRLKPVLGMRTIKKHIFVYFKPNTANNIDVYSPLGIPIYANALSTMKAIDTAIDSFHREFRLGKKRILVPEAMIRTVIDEDGVPQRYFDATDETYEALAGNMDDTEMKDVSVQLRVEEHVAAINALLNLFSMQTGFSSGTFTFDGESMKTATEVISEQSKTFKSKQSHEVIIESGLQDLIEAILAVAEQYKMFFAKKGLEVTISFDDSIAEDKAAEINKQVQLVSAELQSKKRAIMKIFGVTEDEAMQIVAEIQEERLKSSPDLEELEQEGAIFGARE